MNGKIRNLLACTLTVGALLSTAAFSATASAASTMAMEATAYGLTAQDNYPYGATDYFGQPLTAGDIAVDPSVIPLGTCLYVTGYSSPYLPKGGFIGEADDTGGAIKGAHIDIFEALNNESLISNFGIQRVRVTILGKSPDSPSQASGTAACKMYAKGATGAANSGAGGQGGSTSGTQGASGTKGQGGSSSGTQGGSNAGSQGGNGSGATSQGGSSAGAGSGSASGTHNGSTRPDGSRVPGSTSPGKKTSHARCHGWRHGHHWRHRHAGVRRSR